MELFKSLETRTKLFSDPFKHFEINEPLTKSAIDEIFNADELKDLLVRQIENRVRWRESVVNMINKGVGQFIEIGPGKVLSGLVKRINRKVKVISINNVEEIKDIKDIKI